jgi:hypothetical protein
MERAIRHAAAAVVVVVVSLAACGGACGGEVTVDGRAGPIDVCTCMATWNTEPLPGYDEFGPCKSCWIRTVTVEEGELPDGADGNGACHYNQQRCLDDTGCKGIFTCVQACDTASCIAGCLAPSTLEAEVAKDLALDWLRCFCVECTEECNAHPPTGTCAAGLQSVGFPARAALASRT